MNRTLPPTLSLPTIFSPAWNGIPRRSASFFHLAADVKAHPDRYRGALAGRFLALIFEKPSLRTRVTFEVGIASLGGSSVFLDHTVTHLGERESIPRRRQKSRTLGHRHRRARVQAGIARRARR